MHHDGFKSYLNGAYFEALFTMYCSAICVFERELSVMHCAETDCTVPERIYNSITAMGFLAMFTFQLDNPKR